MKEDPAESLLRPSSSPEVFKNNNKDNSNFLQVGFQTEFTPDKAFFRPIRGRGKFTVKICGVANLNCKFSVEKNFLGGFFF